LHGVLVQMSKLGIILCLLPAIIFLLILGLAIWDQDHHLSFPCWIDLDCHE
jgi:hypothetical protein